MEGLYISPQRSAVGRGAMKPRRYAFLSARIDFGGVALFLLRDLPRAVYTRPG